MKDLKKKIEQFVSKYWPEPVLYQDKVDEFESELRDIIDLSIRQYNTDFVMQGEDLPLEKFLDQLFDKPSPKTGWSRGLQ